MNVTRRGFLGLLGGAIAAAGAGITLVAPAIAKSAKLVHARHLYQYDGINNYPPRFPVGDCYVHRIDVKVYDERLRSWSQLAVDVVSGGEKLDPERELAPALVVLNNDLEDKGYEVGEIHSYSMEEWNQNRAAQDAWNSIKLGARRA